MKTIFNTDHLKHDLKKKAMGGAGATVLSRIGDYLIRLISTIVLARILTPREFGLVAMVSVISMFFMQYRNLGLTNAIIQVDNINHRQISTLFWINLAFCFFLMSLFIGLAPFIAWFYNEPKLKMITVIMSFNFILGGLSTQHLALLKRNMQFISYGAIEILATSISVIVAIFLALYGCGYWSLVARGLSLSLSISVLAWVFCRWRPGLPSFNSEIWPMLSFGINSLGTYTLNFFSSNLDKILIGWKYGAQSLGYYEKAYSLFLAPSSQLTYPLGAVSIATLSRLRDFPEKFHHYYLNAVSMLAFIGFLMSAIFALTGKDLIVLLLGSKWTKAGEIVSVLGLAIGIQLLYVTHGWLHQSLGRADRWFRWGVIGSVAMVLSFVIGLNFGPMGVAIAYTISFYVLICPSIWYAGKPIKLKLSFFLATIWKYFLSAFFAGMTSWFFLYSFDLTSSRFLELSIYVRLLLSCSLCIFFYFIFIILFYQNVKPIIKFVSSCIEMIPRLPSKQSKSA